MLRIHHLFLILFVALASCQSGGTPSSKGTSNATTTRAVPPRNVPAFAQPIEAAHGAEAFLRKDALRFEYALRYGEQELLAEVYMKTDMSRIRMQRPDGAQIVWDGEDAYLSPADAEWRGPRFTVLTHPYFLCAPFKLADPGTHLEPKGDAILNDTTYATAKLSFDDGVGDSPKDWYLLYRDKTSDLLRAMAYIVTANRSVEEAEASPSAITYHNFVKIEGVQFPTEFRFWKWNETEGLTERKGTAYVGGFRFVKTDKFTFGIPLSNRKI